jgi:hypothetical protein
MQTCQPKPQIEIPEDVEITRCKPSRRGRRSRDLNMTGGCSARHKPHKHRVSWEAAEAFAAGIEKA